MNLDGQHIVVVGLARSGLAAARFLISRGARVTVTDQADPGGLGPMVEHAHSLGAQLELGGHNPATFEAADQIVISPGVPQNIEPLVRARKKGIPITGEIELAACNIRVPIIAISGTNGKTTTTELLGRMLAASGRQVFVGGNIGNPLIEIVDRETELDIVVAEISSFQLDTTQRFHPHVAVLLNISPDHLDRYADMQAYAVSKGALFRNQTGDDYAICHGSDPLVQQQVAPARSRIINFYPRPPVNGLSGPGAVIFPDHIELSVPEKSQGDIDLTRTGLTGGHNSENIAAAALATLCAGGTLSGIRKALDEFQPIAHRMELVRNIRGIRYYNDSKATNVDAVQRALESFDGPIILIMGGRNKGNDFTSLYHQIRKSVKKLIVIGEAADQILSALTDASRGGASKAQDLADAVAQAEAVAHSGDVVLLSPACASFDMFANYAERGEVFHRLVGELQ